MLSKGGGRPISARVNVVLNEGEPWLKRAIESDVTHCIPASSSPISCCCVQNSLFNRQFLPFCSKGIVASIRSSSSLRSRHRSVWFISRVAGVRFNPSRTHMSRVHIGVLRKSVAFQDSLDIVFITCRRSSIRNCQLNRDRPPPSGLPVRCLLFVWVRRISGTPSAPGVSRSLEWI